MYVNLILLSICIIQVYCENFYEILGIKSTANDKEIRKSFKAKALKLHPDKNTNDKTAESKFIKLNRAYEVLKDPELRKKYDLYGEDVLDESRKRGQQYHTWTYYKDNFGIYDDDPDIITLNTPDFETNVLGSDDIWFINFYHPSCSHCHTLAPTWRKLSYELNHVIRIGAVNCEDEYMLCRSQGIRSYPSLIAYPKKKSFEAEKSFENLANFILKSINIDHFIYLNNISWKTNVKNCFKPWLFIPTNVFENDDIEFYIFKIKLGAMFEDVLCLGEINCLKYDEICSTMKISNKIVFYKNSLDVLVGASVKIESFHPQEVFREILKLIPEIKKIDAAEFKKLRENLQRSRLENIDNLDPMLIIFTSSTDVQNLEFRKISSYLETFDIYELSCEEPHELCNEFFVSKTSSIFLFKSGGGYESYQGRNLARDISNFARESALANRYQVLTPVEFPQILKNGAIWVIDFYAPWCPPCKKLLPEFRKASRIADSNVRFGSVDCTIHHSLCQLYTVRQYPTIILFRDETILKQVFGFHSANDVYEEIQDALDPKVITLDDVSLHVKVGKKPKTELWIVDFYANWCGHCQQMVPEYRRFARLVSSHTGVFVAQIDCALHRESCKKFDVRGYPTIRLYPFQSDGMRRSAEFNSYSRTAESFRLWLQDFLPLRAETLDESGFESVLFSSFPHLVMFYTPWCGACRKFKAVFEEIAEEFGDDVKFGKVNCVEFGQICDDASISTYPTLIFYSGTKLESSGTSKTGKPELNSEQLNQNGGQGGTEPGQSHEKTEKSGNKPGQSNEKTGKSGNKPEQSHEKTGQTKNYSDQESSSVKQNIKGLVIDSTSKNYIVNFLNKLLAYKNRSELAYKNISDTRFKDEL